MESHKGAATCGYSIKLAKNITTGHIFSYWLPDMAKVLISLGQQSVAGQHYRARFKKKKSTVYKDKASLELSTTSQWFTITTDTDAQCLITKVYFDDTSE